MKCKLITGWSTSSKVILIAHNRWRIHSVCIYSKHCPGIQYWACILCFKHGSESSNTRKPNDKIYRRHLHIVISAANANSRQSELDSVEEWSWTNNLKVNLTKYAEIIFTDKRRKTVEQPPAPMPNIKSLEHENTAGVTFTSGLSRSEHIQDIINSCA